MNPRMIRTSILVCKYLPRRGGNENDSIIGIVKVTLLGYLKEQKNGTEKIFNLITKLIFTHPCLVVKEQEGHKFFILTTEHSHYPHKKYIRLENFHMKANTNSLIAENSLFI
jgi:hypothetical protein